MPERLDRLHVDVAGEIVQMTWNERDTLLKELTWAEGTKSIRERFEAVEASRPVELNREQRLRLRGALDAWEDRLQPEGIVRLHAALWEAGPNF